MTPELALLLAPALAGGILAAFDTQAVNDTTERVEGWTRKRQATASQGGFLAKYVFNPLLWAVVKFCDWTDGFANRGLRNGARVAGTLYLLAAWLYVLYAAFMIAVVLLLGAAALYVIFKVLVNSNDDVRRGYETGRRAFAPDARSEEKEVLDPVGLRGKNVYAGTNWLNEELRGRVDDEGNIYRGTNWLNEEKIGRIDADGTILRGTSFLNEEKVGRVDEDGNLHRGTNWFNEEKTGRIDDDGNIHEGTNWFNEEKRGRTGD
jgi:hypothetical protein